MPSHRLLEVETLGEDAVARCTCRALDWETSRAVGDELTRLIRRPGRQSLRLDLGGVQFVTAAGWGMLVAAHNELRARGGRLVLCNVAPLAHEVFRVTRLDRLLDIRLPLAGGDAGGRPSIPRPACRA